MLDHESPTNDTVRMVMGGQRLIQFPYVVSIIFISFHRTMGVVKVGEDAPWPLWPLIRASLVTVLFGWWGLPLSGGITSIVTLAQLWKGGQDITRLLLIQSVGHPETRRILTSAPKPALPRGMWLVRLIILSPLAVLGAGVAYFDLTNGRFY